MPVNYGPKTAKFISRLVQLTQEGKLKWQTVPVTSRASYPSFKARVAGRDLELSCDAPPATTSSQFVAGYLGMPTRTVVLSIGPSSDAEPTRLVNATGSEDLYDSVFRMVGGLDKLFDDVLK
jgi:hypothetical protein